MKLNCIVFGYGRIGKLHINNLLKLTDKFKILYLRKIEIN